MKTHQPEESQKMTLQAKVDEESKGGVEQPSMEKEVKTSTDMKL